MLIMHYNYIHLAYDMYSGNNLYGTRKAGFESRQSAMMCIMQGFKIPSLFYLPLLSFHKSQKNCMDHMYTCPTHTLTTILLRTLNKGQLMTLGGL